MLSRHSRSMFSTGLSDFHHRQVIIQRLQSNLSLDNKILQNELMQLHPIQSRLQYVFLIHFLILQATELDRGLQCEDIKVSLVVIHSQYFD